MITIAGLTELQRDLADQLWALDSQQQIDLWFSTLPRAVQRQAAVVQHLIIAAELDSHMEVTHELSTYLGHC